MKRITVLIAEDHTIVREGIRRLLERAGELEVVGEAPDGRQAVEMAKKLHPNVVLMDVSMPMLNGLEATRRILKDLPDTKVLILSAHSDDTCVEQAATFGAVGYLLKQASSSHILATAIREVQKGKNLFSSSVSKCVENRSRQLADQGGSKKIGNRLSSREVEVLQLIAEGNANKQVAAELGLSFKTVDKHRQHLMNKLDIHDIASLTRYAIGAGVIETNTNFATGWTHPPLNLPVCCEHSRTIKS